MNLLEVIRGTQAEKSARTQIARLNGLDHFSANNKRQLARAHQTVANERAARRKSGIVYSIEAVGLAGILYLAKVGAEQIQHDDVGDLHSAATSLGLQHSADEESIWKNGLTPPYSDRELHNGSRQQINEFIAQIDPRIEEVISDLMPKSKNNSLQETAKFINLHRDVLKDLQIRPRTTDFAAGRDRYTMAVDYVVEDGKIVWLIQPTASMILGRDHLDIAFQFVHQAEHITNFIEEIDSLPDSMNAEAKLVMLTGIQRSKWSAMEARAYGAQSKAMIAQYAITGGGLVSSDATALARCGMETNSSCWRRHIDKKISGR